MDQLSGAMNLAAWQWLFVGFGSSIIWTAPLKKRNGLRQRRKRYSLITSRQRTSIKLGLTRVAGLGSDELTALSVFASNLLCTFLLQPSHAVNGPMMVSLPQIAIEANSR